MITKECAFCEKTFKAKTNRKRYCDRIRCQRARRNRNARSARSIKKLNHLLFLVAAKMHNQKPFEERQAIEQKVREERRANRTA